jgi:hypothetical protein
MHWANAWTSDWMHRVHAGTSNGRPAGGDHASVRPTRDDGTPPNRDSFGSRRNSIVKCRRMAQ